jgi:hypothetical protein
MGGSDTLYINKTLFSANKIIDIHPTVQYTDDKHINTMDARTTRTQYLEGQTGELTISLDCRVCDAKYAIPTFWRLRSFWTISRVTWWRVNQIIHSFSCTTFSLQCDKTILIIVSGSAGRWIVNLSGCESSIGRLFWSRILRYSAILRDL